MIVETVTTTINPDGTVNCAAMGVEWGEEAIVIKPYRATRTLRNLERHGAAVVHLTDDILLFTEAALDDPHPPTRPAAAVEGAVLADACSWREVAVEAIEASGPRARVDDPRRRPRDRARVRRLQPRGGRRARGVDPRLARPPAARGEIRAELARLAVVVDKTAGPRERAAMELVLATCAPRRRRMTTVRVEAPARLHLGMLDASGDGRAAVRRARRGGRRPAAVRRGERGRRAHRRGAGRRARARGRRRCRAALGAARPAPGCAWSRRSRRTSASARARSSRSPWPRRWPRWRGRRRTRRRWRAWPAAARARRSACGRSRSAGSWSRAAAAAAPTTPAPLLVRHAMPDEWRCVLAIPAAEPGLSGGAEEEAFAGLRPDPERSALIAQIVLTALLPALVERDLAEFGAALTPAAAARGRRVRAGPGRDVPPAGRRRSSTRCCATARPGRARARGDRPCTASSGSEAAGRDARRRLEAELGAGGRVEVVPFDNEGARVEVRMKLLVSVVDAAEARLAVAGGVDVVDVKNPAEGSLGAPAPAVIAAVRAAVPPELPLSAALGDLPALPGTAALAALGAARSGAAYVKVGLWGSSNVEEAVAVLRAAREAVDGDAAVVAVAYADAARVPSRPLAPAALVAAARARRASAGAWSTPRSRTAAGCFEWLDARRARGVRRRGARRRARDRAGRRAARRGPARPCAPRGADIAGVRSAACRDGRRTAPLDPERIARLRALCARVGAAEGSRHASRVGRRPRVEQLGEPRGRRGRRSPTSRRRRARSAARQVGVDAAAARSAASSPTVSRAIGAPSGGQRAVEAGDRLDEHEPRRRPRRRRPTRRSSRT